MTRRVGNFAAEFFLLGEITQYNPCCQHLDSRWKPPKEVQLAYPDFYSECLSFLTELWPGQIKLGNDWPQTLLGWKTSVSRAGCLY